MKMLMESTGSSQEDLSRFEKAIMDLLGLVEQKQDDTSNKLEMLRKIEVSIQESIDTRNNLEKDKEMKARVGDKEKEIEKIRKDRKTLAKKMKQKEKEL